MKRVLNMKNGFMKKPYGEKYLSFEFKNKEDRERVLEIGCFHTACQLFVVRSW